MAQVAERMKINPKTLGRIMHPTKGSLKLLAFFVLSVGTVMAAEPPHVGWISGPIAEYAYGYDRSRNDWLLYFYSDSLSPTGDRVEINWPRVLIEAQKVKSERTEFYWVARGLLAARDGSQVKN